MGVRAKQIHTDVRSQLSEIGWKPETRQESIEMSATEMTAGKLFPAEWFDILNEELLADLIVDSFANTISDAFVDGAILLYDADARSRGQRLASPTASPRTRLAASSSEPSLGRGGARSTVCGTASRPLPQIKTPFTTMPPHGDLQVRGDRGPSGGRQRLVAGGRGAPAAAGSSIVAPREGFTQAGLPQNEREAWQRTHYHVCQPLQDYRTRIHQATELQRPKRQVKRTPASSGSQTKYVWPSTQYHFPEAWDKMTEKPTEKWKESAPVMTVSEEGKSVIPYSLVLHKAFLDSQPASLRGKAESLVPLKLTSSSADL